MKSILSEKSVCMARSSLSHTVRLIQSAQPNTAINKEIEEITIKVPWGHIAGKWWGPKNIRPIVSLHGWQDNAGTFDRLMPLLPNHISYLAIDLPGHGKSSHFPPGMTYSTLDFVNAIEIVRYEMKWDRVSLMAHSMGSQMSFYYASMLPELCDMLIGIDVLKPLVRSQKRLLNDLSLQMTKIIVEHKRLENPTEPPSYTQEELIARMVEGTKNSVTPEVAMHLIERNILPSVHNPNKYFFRRDSRLKFFNYSITFHDMVLHMARKIVVPHLFIKASNSSYYEEPKYFHETIEVLKENPLFKFVQAEGTHHIHLTDPTKISTDISEFIQKYRPPK